MASRLLRGLRLGWTLPASWLALGGAAGPAVASGGDGWTSPLNPSPASISGALRVGETLRADPGTWTNDPDHFEYQWISCDGFRIACESIAGATDPTYVIREADANRSIGLDIYSYPASRLWEWVRVAAVGPVLASPTPVSAPPASRGPPSVSGTPVEGGALSADPGAWSGSPTSYRYQWYSCGTTLDGDGVPRYACGELAGATGASYRLSEVDLYRGLQVRVIATNAGGDSRDQASATTGIVLPLPATNTVRPAVSAGPVQEGGELVVTQGAWASSWSRTGETIEHQWLRCGPAGTDCAVIDGQRGQVYMVTSADLGLRIVVEEFEVNAGGRSAPAVSDPSAVVAAALPGTPIWLASPHLGPNGPEFWVQARNPDGSLAYYGQAPAAVATGPTPPALPPGAGSPPRGPGSKAAGTLALLEQARGPGTFTGLATINAPAATGARASRTCPGGCPGTRAVYGRGSAKAAGRGRVVLVIKPTRQARRVIAGAGAGGVRVRVRVTFVPRRGGPRTTRIVAIAVAGT